MKPQSVRIISFIIAVLAAVALVIAVNGENGDDGDAGQNRDVGQNCDADARQLSVNVSCTDADADIKVLTDDVKKTYTAVKSKNSVTITSADGTHIGSLYVIFDRIYGDWTLSGVDKDGKTHTVSCGGDRFLHEYIDVKSEFGGDMLSLTLTFDGDNVSLDGTSLGDASLSEIYAFSSGRVPEWVQIWQPPCERADLLLASTHVDDEQLFFAGILPYYAGERGYAVQVVYFTDPFKYHDRPHEQLDGLWTVGVRNYPVSGVFVDEFSESTKDAYAHQEKHGYTKDEMIEFQVRAIRRFLPHVVVGHDINGEYGHGQHMINCETLMEALPLAADASYDAESAAAYGVWDVPKTYIHLWGENKIVMDFDKPLESFGGKTAFEMTQAGFMCHKSQHWTWFYGWIYGKNGKKIKKATDIKTHSPCKYGLYRTTVGLDTGVGDMFENIPKSYAEIEDEEMAALAAAESRRVAEESSRIESEAAQSRRLESEAESRRLESEAAHTGSENAQPPDTGKSGDGKGAAPYVVIFAACGAAVTATVIAALGAGKKKEKTGQNTK